MTPIFFNFGPAPYPFHRIRIPLLQTAVRRARLLQRRARCAVRGCRRCTTRDSEGGLASETTAHGVLRTPPSIFSPCFPSLFSVRPPRALRSSATSPPCL